MDLTDVRVDPSANLDIVLCLDLAQVFLGVGEVDWVPSERAPIEASHPAVDVSACTSRLGQRSHLSIESKGGVRNTWGPTCTHKQSR